MFLIDFFNKSCDKFDRAKSGGASPEKEYFMLNKL